MKTTKILLLLAPLLLLKPPTITSNDITIQELNSPLLPFNLGKTRLIQSKHTFYHYVETEPIKLQLTNINYFYHNLELILNRTNSNNSSLLLNNLLHQAKYLLDTAKNKMNNLSIKTRQKRGLINIVGKASKWLFGTLDSSDQEKYDSEIQFLKNHLHKVEHEQTLQASLSEDLIEHYNQTITKLFKNQILIKSNLEDLTRNINSDVKNIFNYLSFSNTIDQIILNCQNLINFLDNLENAIMFAHFGVLHNSVISLANLKKLTSYLSEIYPGNRIHKFENTFHYYELAGLQVRFNSDKIIFAIHFPILTEDISNTYHLIPLPYKNSIIIPDHPYLVLGASSHQYEDATCPELDSTFFCMKHEFLGEDRCILPLIKAESPDCSSYKATLVNPIVQQINSQNILVVPATEPIKALRSCETKAMVLIKKTSLVALPENCSVSINGTLFSNIKDTVPGEPLILPEIQADTISTDFSSDPIQLQSIDLNSIKSLKEKSIYINSRKPTEKSSPTQIALIIIGITCLVLALCLLQYWWRKLKNTESNPPQEAEEINPSPALLHLKEGGVK